MKIDKAKITLVFTLFVFIFSVLALFFWDFTRDTIVVPIYHFIWIISLILNSIPQGAYLAILVILSLITGFTTLANIKVGQNPRHNEEDQSQTYTQYMHWKNLYDHLYINPFSRGRFAWEARKLILSILALEQGIDIDEVEALFRNGALDVSERSAT